MSVQIRIRIIRLTACITNERFVSRMSVHMIRHWLAFGFRVLLAVLLQVRTIFPLTGVWAFAASNMSIHVLVEFLRILELFLTVSPLASKRLKGRESIQDFYSKTNLFCLFLIGLLIRRRRKRTLHFKPENNLSTTENDENSSEIFLMQKNALLNGNLLDKKPVASVFGKTPRPSVVCGLF
jgi:hypothetical protein